METKSKFARRHGVGFKQNAVALVPSVRRLAAVCRDWGCSIWSLGRWMTAAKNGAAQTEPKTLAAESPEQGSGAASNRGMPASNVSATF